eukprot:TRINITY_DN2958_c0_g2_i2.p1 TRINITY_DN2958_c0_g2~~TRINITY_DN2958_c0_g2_i2.p1  ORF type:complete len:1421 (-),score=501.03 TRINITY_DN2958_c0_g2_i2:57-4319(-)
MEGGDRASVASRGSYYEDPLEDDVHINSSGFISKARKKMFKSVEITIINRTGLHLTFKQGGLQSGEWTALPNNEIRPFRQIVFSCQSTGLFGSIAGSVIYESFNASPNIGEHVVPCNFSFHWENTEEFSRRSSSTDFVIAIRPLKGDPPSVTFVIKNALTPGIPEKYELDLIKKRTYFSLRELRLIWRSFSDISEGYKEITKEAFVRAFPEFNNDTVLRSLFSSFAAFSDRNEETIDFDEFASVLSVMTRGNPSEQVQLSFNICDVDKSGRLDRGEAAIVARHFADVLSSLGYDEEMYGAPEEVLDDLFAMPTSDLRFFSKPITSEKGGHKVHTLKDATKKVIQNLRATYEETKEHLSGEIPEDKQEKLEKQESTRTIPFPSLGRGPNANTNQSTAKSLPNQQSSGTSVVSPAFPRSPRSPKFFTPKISASPRLNSPRFAATPYTRAGQMNRAQMVKSTPGKNLKPITIGGNGGIRLSGINNSVSFLRQSTSHGYGTLNEAPKSSVITIPRPQFLQTRKYRRTMAVQKGASKSGAREIEWDDIDDELDEGMIVDGLTKTEVLERASEDSDFVHCFGLFTYFYKRILEPIEHELSEELEVYADHYPEYRGWLLKDKGEDFISKSVQLLGGGLDRRYFVIRDGFIAYYRNENDLAPLNVVSLQGAVLREGGDRESFYLKASNWSRMLYAENRKERKKWVQVIRSNIKGVYRFKSYAPIRKDCLTKWFIGGAEYFSDLYEQLLNAKERIFIADWFLSPQLYLIRESPLKHEHRLDYVLRKKADEGVMINILIWNASQLAFDLRSEFVCEFMNRLHHKNITCISHPNWYPMTWSHHQKFVVIDEECAYVGGIDLCYNRYDDNRYLLNDTEGRWFPGKDYGNLCIVGESNGTIAEGSSVDRFSTPRMPWHDIHMRVIGDAARDVGLNFIQRWNHALSSGSEVATTFNNHSQTPADITMMAAITVTIGGIYLKTAPITSTSIYTDEKSRQIPNIVRNRAPAIFLLPKGGVKLNGWIHNWESDRKKRGVVDGINVREEGEKEGNESVVSDHINEKETELSGNFKTSVQLLRSAGVWSAGLSFTEVSIYKAYLTAIKQAKHFIFIENQYFISSINRMRPKNKILKTLHKRLRLAITNGEEFKVIVVIPVYPAGSLVDIATRYVIKYVYKTIGRQGHSIIERLEDEFPNVDVSQYISFYSLRNHNYNQLDKETLDILAEDSGTDDDQIRGEQDRENTLDNPSVTKEEAQDKVWTEQIYIHAKMMIVDDRIALIGSANINDRSMRGSRDSEICTIIESPESEMIDSVMGGQKFKVSPFAHTLRMRLWRDFLAIKKEDDDILRDPCSPAAFGLWQGTASRNTKIYMEVFPDIPDHIRSLASMGKNTRPSNTEKLKKVVGFLIEFPKSFLEDEQMSPTIWNKEYILPRNIFL